MALVIDTPATGEATVKPQRHSGTKGTSAVKTIVDSSLRSRYLGPQTQDCDGPPAGRSSPLNASMDHCLVYVHAPNCYSGILAAGPSCISSIETTSNEASATHLVLPIPSAVISHPFYPLAPSLLVCHRHQFSSPSLQESSWSWLMSATSFLPSWLAHEILVF